MNTSELQQLKMAWLAAEEAGDKQAQVALLHDHPVAQDALIDFIAAYHVTAPVEETSVLPLTQRAYVTAMERVFGDASVAATLRELRTRRGLSLALTRSSEMSLTVAKALYCDPKASDIVAPGLVAPAISPGLSTIATLPFAVVVPAMTFSSTLDSSTLSVESLSVSRRSG